MNREAIEERLERNQIPHDAALAEKLEIYLRLLQEWNARMDLTATLEAAETADRHFIDSLAVLRTDRIFPGASLIDVGTGAGFPGMVLAMARPDLSVTLTEDAGRDRKYREMFDFAAARAVAPLNVLAEYLLPFVKVGGCALGWKGPALEKELEAGRRAARLLGGRLELPEQYTVDGRDWEHTILPIRKVEKTPSAYPRKAGTPKAKPLGE